jgi:hypothetical protein
VKYRPRPSIERGNAAFRFVHADLRHERTVSVLTPKPTAISLIVSTGSAGTGRDPNQRVGGRPVHAIDPTAYPVAGVSVVAMTDTMTNGNGTTSTAAGAVTRAAYVEALDTAVSGQRDVADATDVLDAVRTLLRMTAEQRALVEQLVSDGLALGVERADDEITRARSVHGLTAARRSEQHRGKGKR